MSDIKSEDISSKEFSSSSKQIPEEKSVSEKGPMSFLSGALTSCFFAWLSLNLSQGVVGYFSTHSLNYSSPIAQSIASGFKTLLIGICFLATFTFGFIGLGLIIVFLRSLFRGKESDVV